MDDFGNMGQQGTIYLLCFHKEDSPEEPTRYKHAGHYLGWTSLPLEERLARHRAGNGAALVRHILGEGYDFKLVRTWKGDRYMERRLKNRHGSRLCPRCNGNHEEEDLRGDEHSGRQGSCP